MPGLSTEIRTRMAIYLGPQPDPPLPMAANNDQKFPFESSGTRSYCQTCKRECHGEGYRKKKNDLPRMTTQCQKCGETCCRNHLITLCGDCGGKANFPAPAAANPPRREVD